MEVRSSRNLGLLHLPQAALRLLAAPCRHRGKATCVQHSAWPKTVRRACRRLLGLFACAGTWPIHGV